MSQVDLSNNRLLTISQVNALTGVKKSTIRHWEQEFTDFLASVRTEGNQRRFTSDAIEKIEVIKNLVEEQGLTLKGVRRHMEGVTSVGNPGKETVSELNTDVQKLAKLVSEHMMRRIFKEET
jgi:DNA-binding transcriptional MerR regulator